MPESERDPGWKPSAAALVGLIIAAAGLSALTCWVFKINPLPTTGHVLDTGWFATFGLVYFFALYLTIERLRRRR